MTNTYPTNKNDGIKKAVNFINEPNPKKDREQIFQIEFDQSFASTVLYGVNKDKKFYSLRTTYHWQGDRNIGLDYCHLEDQIDFVGELRKAMQSIGYVETDDSIRNNHLNWANVRKSLYEPFVSWW